MLVLKTTSKYDDIGWFGFNNKKKMAYDHKDILKVAYRRLQTKIGYTNIAQGILPKFFTLTQLQKAYEII